MSTAVDALTTIAEIVGRTIGGPCEVAEAPQAPSVPSAWLMYDSLRPSVDGPGVALSQRGYVMSCRLVIFPKVGAGQTGRTLSILGAASSVITALHAYRSLGGLVLDCLASHDAPPVEAAGGPRADVAIEVTWIGEDEP